MYTIELRQLPLIGPLKLTHAHNYWVLKENDIPIGEINGLAFNPNVGSQGRVTTAGIWGIHKLKFTTTTESIFYNDSHSVMYSISGGDEIYQRWLAGEKIAQYLNTKDISYAPFNFLPYESANNSNAGAYTLGLAMGLSPNYIDSQYSIPGWDNNFLGEHSYEEFRNLLYDPNFYLNNKDKIKLSELVPYTRTTTAGIIGSTVASGIAAEFVDDSFSEQLLARTMGQTIGGWLVELPVLLNSEINVNLIHSFLSVPANFVTTGIHLGSSELSGAMIDAWGINDPLAQLGVSSFTSAATNYLWQEAVLDQLAETTVGERAALQYFGAQFKLNPDGQTVSYAPTSFGSLLANTAASALGAYAGQYAYQKLVRWNLYSEYIDQDSLRLGSTVGGLAGSAVAVAGASKALASAIGISSAIGTPLAGLAIAAVATLTGLVYGATFGDKEYPRAGYKVDLDSDTKMLDGVLAYALDDGNNADIAIQMGKSAKDVLNTILTMVDGRVSSLKPIYYGHYKKQYIWQEEDDAPGGSSYRLRHGYGDPQQAVIDGVHHQLLNLEIDGGNPYVRNVLATQLPADSKDFNLNAFFTQIQVAREYSSYLDNPVLYNKSLALLEETQAAKTSDWIESARFDPEIILPLYDVVENQEQGLLLLGKDHTPLDTILVRKENDLVVDGHTVENWFIEESPVAVVQFVDGSRFVIEEQGDGLLLVPELVANGKNIQEQAKTLGLDTLDPLSTMLSSGTDGTAQGTAKVFPSEQTFQLENAESIRYDGENYLQWQQANAQANSLFIHPLGGQQLLINGAAGRIDTLVLETNDYTADDLHFHEDEKGNLVIRFRELEGSAFGNRNKVLVKDWQDNLNQTLERIRIISGNGSVTTFDISLNDDGAPALAPVFAVNASNDTAPLTTPKSSDVLVFDIDGDGLSLLTPDISPARFDLDRDGFMEASAWVGGVDALLVEDVNSNGRIDDSTELISLSGQQGSRTLASYDDNKDGVVNANDDNYARLRIWQDANYNGETDLNELSALYNVGITAISLTNNQALVGVNGAQAIAVGGFQREGYGREGLLSYYATTFAYQPAGLKLTPEYANGLAAYVYENERDILFADGSSTAIDYVANPLEVVSVKGGVQNDSLTTRIGLGEGVILHGEGGDDLLVGGDGNDQLTGGYGQDKLQGGAGDDIMTVDLDDDFDALSGGDGFDAIVIDDTAQVVETEDWFTFTDAHSIEVITGSNSDNRITYARNNQDIVIAGGEGNDHLIGGRGNDRLEGDDGDDHLEGKDGNNVLLGGSGNDRIEAGSGEDILSGDDGDDHLDGGWGNDTLDGGFGNDQLSGNYGNDTYLYAPEGGIDTLVDRGDESDLDIVVFGSEVSPEDVLWLRTKGLYSDRYDLKIAFKDSNARLYIKNQFQSNRYGIEEFHFADGTIIGQDAALSLASSITPHNDLIMGSGGKDILRGAAGHDLLRGFEGDDTYLFNLGDGVDTITDSGGIDHLQLGAGISSNDIYVNREKNDLKLTVRETTDTVILKDYFSRSILAIEEIRFQDGTTWNVSNVQQHILANATSGNDVIHATQSDDVIKGGKGNDRLTGDDGSDTYQYESGDGYDLIQEQGKGGETDSIEFGVGISQENLIYAKDGYNLHIGFNHIGGQLRVEDHFRASYSAIEELSFTDGSVFSLQELPDALPESLPQNTVKQGGRGDDILIAGGGWSVLEGREGSDTYRFARNSGNTELVDRNLTASNTDFNRLKLDGFSPEDLLFSRIGDDALIKVKDTNDQLLIQGQFGFFSSTLDHEGIDVFEFSEDVTWSKTDFEKKVLESTNSERDDAIHLYHHGSEILQIDLGKGNDSIYGGTGNNKYIFSLSDGKDRIRESHYAWHENNDILLFRDIKLSELNIYRDDDDVIFDVISTNDQLEIEHQFDYPTEALSIERFEFADGVVWDKEQLKKHVFDKQFTEGDDEILGYTFGSNQEVISAGFGNDEIDGGDGKDTYIYNIGDGQDTISDGDRYENDLNVIKIGEGIDPASIRISGGTTSYNGDLRLDFPTPNDSLEIKNFTLYEIFSHIEFADGTIWEPQQVRNWLELGYEYGIADPIILLEGDAGDNRLVGASTRDNIRGNEGSDYLTGLGDDDLYHFSIGDGQDTIDDNSNSEQDSLVFGDGITKESLQLSATESSPDDLLVTFFNQLADDIADSISIVGQFSNSRKGRIESFQFADGSELSWEELYNEVYRWRLIDLNDYNLVEGDQVSNNLFGTPGNDALIGYQGNDSLTGGVGNDVYIYNLGNGRDTIIDESSSNDDRLYLDQGILPRHVKLQRTNTNDLTIQFRHSVYDSLLIKEYFSDDGQIENIQFNDGTVWNKDAVSQQILENEPDPTGPITPTSTNLGSTDPNWSVRGIGDFNRDGTDDILWRKNDGSAMAYWSMDGTATASVDLGATDPGWSVRGIGDFNQDGTDDILWRKNDGSAMAYWSMDGTATASVDLGATDPGWSVRGIGDFNQDGTDDILWRKNDGSAMAYWSMDGTVTASIDLGATDPGWLVQGIGDFHGDGIDDILWRKNDGSAMAYWSMDGTATASIDLGATDLGWSVQGIGDFNQDGTDDILWYKNDGSAMTYWSLEGGDIKGSINLGATSPDWSVRGIGNFNQDGTDDILWHKNDSSAMTYWSLEGDFPSL